MLTRNLGCLPRTELFDSPRVVLSVASQLCAACCYLRENDIIHRDIKTPNILVRRSANGQLHIKLADFDAAIRLPRDGVVKDKDDTAVRGTYLVRRCTFCTCPA